MVRPATARSVRGIDSVGDRESSQHRTSITSESSVAGTVGAPWIDSDAATSSRRRRASVRRYSSTSRREATVTNHASGRSGSRSRPFHRGRGERLLYGVLGVGEVAVAPSDRAEGLRAELAQQTLDVCPGHTSGSGAPSTWRTSIGCWIGTPPGPGAAEARAAISSARSRLSTSIIR